MIKTMLIFLGTFFLTTGYANFRYTSPLTEQSVVILTMPKSGTTLIQKALKLIMGKEMPLEQSCIFNDRFVHFGHLMSRKESVINDPNCLKIIFFRDPRDTIISQMFWIPKVADWMGCLSAGEIRQFSRMPAYQKIHFLLELPERHMSISYFSRVFSEWIADPLVKAFCFEDLVGKRGGGSQVRQEQTLRELAQCLGVELSSDRITAIAMELFGGTTTFRKGEIGEWEKHFNEQHKTLFKEKMGEALIKLGYEEDNQW